LLYGSVGDGFIDPFAVFVLDQFDEAVSLLLELCLCDKLAKVDPSRQGLDGHDIARGRGAIVFLRLASIAAVRLNTCCGEYVLDVAVF